MLQHFNERNELTNLKWILRTNKNKLVADGQSVYPGDYLGVLVTNNIYDNSAKFVRCGELTRWSVRTRDTVMGKVCKISLDYVKITKETIEWIHEYMGMGDYNREKNKYPPEFVHYICGQYNKWLPVHTLALHLKQLFLFWGVKTSGKFQNYFRFKRGTSVLVDRLGLVGGSVLLHQIDLPNEERKEILCTMTATTYIYAKEFNLLPESPRLGRLMYNRSCTPHALEVYQKAVSKEHNTQAVILDGHDYWIQHKADGYTYGTLPTNQFLGFSLGVKFPKYATDEFVNCVMRKMNEDFKTLDKFIRNKNGELLYKFEAPELVKNWMTYYEELLQPKNNRILVVGKETPEIFSPLFSFELHHAVYAVLGYEK